MSVVSLRRIFLVLFINNLVMYPFPGFKNGKEKTREGSAKKIPDLEESFLIFLLTKATKITKGPKIDVSKFTPEFMFQMDFHFSMLKASKGLPPHL